MLELSLSVSGEEDEGIAGRDGALFVGEGLKRFCQDRR